MSRSTTHRRGGWGPTLAIIGGLAALAVGILVIPRMVAPPSASTSPAPTVAQASSALTPGPLPSLPESQYTSVEWTLAAFPDAAFESLSAGVVADRIVLLGVTGQTAAGWYSDDGGETWHAAAVPEPSDGPGEAIPHLTRLVSSDSLVLALGSWIDAASGEGGDALAWRSSDAGASWEIIAPPSDVGSIQMLDLAGSDVAFLGYGINAGAPGEIGWYRSTDGETWSALVGDMPGGDRVLRLAGGTGGLVAAGLDGDRPPGHPAAWFSADGATWQQTLVGVDQPGTATMAIGSPEGFLVAGQLAALDQAFSEATGSPTIWISPDGLRWLQTGFMDLAGSQIGAAALNLAGAVLVIERPARSGESPISTLVRYVRGGTNEMSDEVLPLVGIRATALSDRFVLIGSCVDAAGAACSGTTLALGQPVD